MADWTEELNFRIAHVEIWMPWGRLQVSVKHTPDDLFTAWRCECFGAEGLGDTLSEALTDWEKDFRASSFAMEAVSRMREGMSEIPEVWTHG